MGKRSKKQRRYGRDGITLQWREGTPVAAWRDEETNKLSRVRLANGPRSHAEGQALLDQFAKGKRAVELQNAQHTIGDLWRLWLEDRSQDGLPNDIHQANWVSLSQHFETRFPDHLTADDCREFARMRFEAGRAPSTVNTELARLRTCLSWAHKHRIIDVLPYVWLPTPSPPRSRVLSKDELWRLIRGAKLGDPHVYTFVLLAIATGARHTAILDLKWSGVDWARRTISYDETEKTKDPMSKAWRKGRATVAMPRIAYEALQIAYRGRRTEFVIEHGGRRLKSIRTGFAAAVRRAGLSDVTPHTIRHTVPTMLRQAGVENGTIARVLGHNDERTTDLIYTHTDVEFVRSAAEIIDGLLLVRSEDANHAVSPVGKKRQIISRPLEGRDF